MANLVALEQFGCSFGIADQVFVVRERDITKEFLQKILAMMCEVNTSSPREFFKKKKICFLSDQTVYNIFLAALAEEAKNL
jgi:Glu-tRNA(Gln) amidotransferase subunit E-like FAD-binding protein